MVNRRKAQFYLLILTFVVCFTLSNGFDNTTRRHASRSAMQEVQRTHRKPETKQQRAAGDVQVHRPQRTVSAVKPIVKRKSQKQKHLAKTSKQGTNADLTGPNVCGNKCCTGWTVALKTKKCTK
ncbi:hypothetical protein COCON_G00192290, partial [Conger conger]